MADRNDRDEPVPVISKELIQKFLARVHSFTAVAYSFGKNGVLKYLALLPQINKPATVSSEDDDPTDFDVFAELERIDPNTEREGYFPRCWIHTYRRILTWGRHFTKMRWSERPVARLTRTGKDYLDDLRKEAQAKGIDPKGHIMSHIPLKPYLTSGGMKKSPNRSRSSLQVGDADYLLDRQMYRLCDISQIKAWK